MDTANVAAVYRILDANINRLREALRVIEEYFRFASGDAGQAVILKGLRHQLQAFESGLDSALLLHNRDTGSDPFASVNRPEELGRASIADVARASLKRSQEAARVLEEYVKVIDKPDLSEIAKKTRFELYDIEKRLMGQTTDGNEP